MTKTSLEERCARWETGYAPDINLKERNPITSFFLGLPDTIEKVAIKMGGRTVEFDVNKFMDVLESFK